MKLLCFRYLNGMRLGTDARYPTFTDEKKKADLPMKVF